MRQERTASFSMRFFCFLDYISAAHIMGGTMAWIAELIFSFALELKYEMDTDYGYGETDQ